MGNLYTGMKIFHFIDKVDSLPQCRGEILPPVHIRLKPINACNHSCRYCAYRAEGLQLGQDMAIADAIPAEKMQQIVDDIIEMGVRAVTFSGGGEPLIYPHLAETLRRLATSPVQFATLTNGARLEGEIAELFAHHGTWVRVSIDGWDDASYVEYRGVKAGEFSRVLDNMRRFQTLGGACVLGVSFIVDRNNAPHVYPFVQRMKDLGVDSVKISPCIVSNDGAENNAFHAPVFEQVKEQAQRAVQELADDSFEIFDAYHVLEERFAKNYHWCPYCQILPVIGADLHVYPCQDKAYNRDTGSLGSLHEQSFREFWFAEKARFFRIDPARDCNHHCVANQKNRTLLDYLGAHPDHLSFV